MNRILEVCLVAAAFATSIPSSAAGIKVATDATPQALQRGISVQLATAVSATPMPEADNQNAWIVTVTANGDLDFGIDPVSPAALADEMKSRPRNRDQKLFIKADAGAPFAKVAQVLKVARDAMFETSVLLTSPSHSVAPGTNVRPEGLEVLLAAPAGSHPTEVQVIRSPQHTPTLSINNRQIPWANLQNMLTQFFQTHPEKVVLIKADDQLPFADVVHVIDVSRSAGAKVILATP
jgi:biopolymer transport protein ExbD